MLKRTPTNFLVDDFFYFREICFEQVICSADKSSLYYLLNAPHLSSLVPANNSRYERRKEQEVADNAKMLQAELNDQGADNTTAVYLEGFANGISC